MKIRIGRLAVGTALILGLLGGSNPAAAAGPDSKSSKAQETQAERKPYTDSSGRKVG
jgi:hypothetical protein